MIVLVSGATATLRTMPRDAPLGHLITPRSGNDLRVIAATGRPWAFDNGCFTGLDTPRLLRLLSQVATVQRDPTLRRPWWGVVPDVLGDAVTTLELWHEWLPVYRDYRIPPAFVAQDDAEQTDIPWHELACLFIGGSTAYKESHAVQALIAEATQRGTWVHVGRVNTFRRLALFSGTGVHSVDGTTFSMFPDTYIPTWARRLRNPQAYQHRF